MLLKTTACGRRLGLGVLLAFTVKGIFTTAVMLGAVAAASLEEGHDVLLPVHILVWLAVGIGAYAAFSGTNEAGSKEEPRPRRWNSQV